MLFVSRPVADALQGTPFICGTRLVLIETHKVLSVFILSRSSARLADVYKRRASTVLSAAFLIRFLLLHAAVGSKDGAGRTNCAAMSHLANSDVSRRQDWVFQHFCHMGIRPHPYAYAVALTLQKCVPGGASRPC